jgi:hypothetical protein
MNRVQESDTVNVIPDDISKSLHLLDIPAVFDYLEKTFHISKNWRIFYKNELQQRPTKTSEPIFFCQFLKDHIEPPINRLRMRDDSLFSMLRYLLKDHIAERERQEKRYGGSYKRDDRR